MTFAQPLFDKRPMTDSRAEKGGEDDLQDICRSILISAFPLFHGSEIEASYYPYIGLTHTIRRKNGRWVVRISDHARMASTEVLEAILMILGSKVMRKRPPRECLRIYARFKKDPLIERLVFERRSQRGRKYIGAAAGRHFSLEDIYNDLNRRYFNGKIDVERIGWGLRSSRKRMGHYDPTHHTITVSPVLDAPGVPEFVVRFIVYHEMLHALFDRTCAVGRKKHHSREFRAAEQAHPDSERARRFLGEYCRHLK